MAKTEGKRPERIGERIREELMGLLLRGAVHDPAVRDVVVSGVKVTDDLGLARIYVRSLMDVDDREKARILAGLERATGFLRREIGRALAIRTHPELRFHWDESIDRALSMERIFDELREERSKKGPGEGGGRT